MTVKTFIHGSFQPIKNNFSAPPPANENQTTLDSKYVKWALNKLCDTHNLGTYFGPAQGEKGFIYFAAQQKNGAFFYFRVRDDFKNPILWDIKKCCPLLKIF